MFEFSSWPARQWQRPCCRLGALLVIVCWGCVPQSDSPDTRQTAHVARDDLPIRVELAPTSDVLRAVRLGDELEILEQHRGSVRVRTADGVEGWTGRYALVTADTRVRMDWQKDQSADLISQGTVQALDVLNVHLDPARDSETIYQLQPDEPAELLERRLVVDDIRTEGWFLVRLGTGHSGWLLETRVYSGIPVEVAQFAEGRRITAYFALGSVDAPQMTEAKTTWLWAQSPGRNAAVDFDRIRVFRWSAPRRAYQTIKLERGLRGFLPISVRADDATSPAQFDVLVESSGGFMLRTYEVRGARVVRLGEMPAEHQPVVLTPPPVVTEETEPTGMLERLRSWWRSVS
jgi:hypothetical protein